MKRSHLKPFSFRATLIDKKGKKVTKDYQLSTSKKTKFPRLEREDNSRPEEESTSSFITFEAEPLNVGLTNHEKRQLNLTQKWTDIREDVLKAYSKVSHIPGGQECVVCRQVEAVLRCEHCGPRQYYCLACGHAMHENRNYFHVLELWKVI